MNRAMLDNILKHRFQFIMDTFIGIPMSDLTSQMVKERIKTDVFISSFNFEITPMKNNQYPNEVLLVKDTELKYYIHNGWVPL